MELGSADEQKDAKPETVPIIEASSSHPARIRRQKTLRQACLE
jgi:hypothetical protein